MTSTVTPPPAPPAPSGPPPSGAGPSTGASRVIAILVIVFGSLVVLGALTSAVVATIAAASVHTSSRSVPVDGVTQLDVDVASGSLRLQFADVAEAELEVTSAWGTDRWVLSQEGDTLVVSSPQGFFAGGWLFGGSGDAVLRLPRAVEGADADLTLAAGDLRAEGEFGELGLDLGAGRAVVIGAATDLDAQVSAGSAELELADVDDVSLSVSAGSLDAQLSGSQPGAIVADVSAGRLQLTVPDGSYDVTSDVSAGDFESTVPSSPGARSTIRVELSAGQATLRVE
ncbi:hypothetical protein [Microbacterium sp. CFBP9034]|uniref:hypothetical protein n=1 Tax=Microbacterium sp. CFBP9034 TaxID=3096540 RepID=UPI002A69F123|nr:hypothetical protein [Microbacterium sp. CFBP9034]MDY0908386.1 hypothetical protein [Microbacterium sp. CFBP9034]